MLVKICGNTSVEDALMAQDAGADYLGVIVEHPPSPRSVSLQDALAIRAAVARPVVAVIVNLELQRLMQIWQLLQPGALQLHGDETPELVRQLKVQGATVWAVVNDSARAQLMHDAGADALLVDARRVENNGTIFGGTGHLSDWDLARQLVENQARVVLAGGLNPQNVGAAMESVGPWMVDAVSGVEARKGVKDAVKVHAFVAAVRSEEARSRAETS